MSRKCLTLSSPCSERYIVLTMAQYVVADTGQCWQCRVQPHLHVSTLLRRNNCLLEVNISAVGESHGWSDRLERLRLTVMCDGCRTATDPKEIQWECVATHVIVHIFCNLGLEPRNGGH